MTHNFINFHILISHSPSCLNRDDMNMQKTAIFGGVRRVRISSQSLKRAMRKSDYYAKHLGSPSVRTRELSFLYQKLSESLKDYPKELVSKAIGLLSDKQNIENANIQADAVAPWFAEEVEWLCDALQKDAELLNICDQFLSEQDKKKKKGLIKKAHKIIQKNPSIAALETVIEKAKDVALSGRMATSGLMTSIDGALAVAHAITAHAVDTDIDWFTAVDDLVDNEGDVGAGHLNTQEFSAGVFYRYASLDLSLLQKNLGECEGECKRQKALEIAAHVLHMLATIVPSAKRRSFAADNLADLALVSFSEIPVSLANAFESPVRSQSKGFLAPSIQALNNYWERVHRGYGLDKRCAEFILDDNLKPPAGITPMATLEDLKQWIRQDGKL